MKSKSEKRIYPAKASEYMLLEEIGHGLFATVYRAICRPYQSIVAVKCLDLEKCNCNLDAVSQEAQMMRLLDHPNVMKAHCSFIFDHFLWVVMPYMDGGSCLHIMKVTAPDGFEECVIATILKETLKAISYLHQQGHIHRDVKAGNILVDSNGGVKLGDFGVSACLFGRGDRQRSRNTIVGTPCWMAPEVMEQKYGYDIRADIWSFGITALELAHGHAPFSKFPPMKILLMTLQNAPPGLDREREQCFSKAFKEMLKMCLVKDPNKRPAADKLLKHSFFKQAKSKEYIMQKLLCGLSPLWEREIVLREKDTARLGQRITPFLELEEKSWSEYKRGVSCWHFDIEDVKAQAALIQEEGDIASVKDEDTVSRTNTGKDSDSSSMVPLQTFSSKILQENGVKQQTNTLKDEDTISRTSSDKDSDSSSIQSFYPTETGVKQQTNTLNPIIVNSRQFGPGQWSSGKVKPKQIGRFDVFDGDLELESPGWHEIVRHRKHVEDQQKEQKLDTIPEDKGGLQGILDNSRDIKKSHSEPLLSNQISTSDQRFQETPGPYTTKECSVNEQSKVASSDQQHAQSTIGSLNAALAGRGILEDKGLPINRKNGITVTSTAARSTEISSRSSFSSVLSSEDSTFVPVSVLVPQLKNFLLQIENQHEGMRSLLKAVDPNEILHDGSMHSLALSCPRYKPNEDAEPFLVPQDHGTDHQIRELQSKITNLTNELISTKLRNVQLERQLNAIFNREEEESTQKEQAER